MLIKKLSSMQAGSDDLRARVLLRCLKAPDNERATVTLREAHSFAVDKGSEGGMKEDKIVEPNGWEGIDLSEFDELDDDLGVTQVGDPSTAPIGESGILKRNMDLREGFPKGMFRD